MEASAGKTAIVTGASMGIGRGIAMKLAAQGFDLFLCHLDEQEQAAEVAEDIKALYGRRCVTFRGDLRQPETAERLIRGAVDTFGSIQVLVSNAGVTKFHKVREMSAIEFDELIALNYRAPMLLIGLISNHMIDRGIRGSIVQISSSRATRAYPTDALYGGIKAALERSIQTIALELAPYGIRANTVAPGAIQVREDNDFYRQLAPKIPLSRVGLPEDIGNAVAFLCSEQSSYITGISIRVDGGLILPGMPETPSYNRDDLWGEIR